VGVWAALAAPCCCRRSTLRISLTCRPLGPGPAQTSSVAPGGTLSWPLRSTTLTCRKASPDPSASYTNPNPLSGLYHLTTAWNGGPEGASNLWALNGDPKLCRGHSKLSSSKLRHPNSSTLTRRIAVLVRWALSNSGLLVRERAARFLVLIYIHAGFPVRQRFQKLRKSVDPFDARIDDERVGASSAAWPVKLLSRSDKKHKQFVL
jgi:hypothetical protein